MIDPNTIASRPDVVARVALDYPGDWWRHRDGLRRPVPLVVGYSDRKDLPPREALDTDPLWVCPDGLAPILALASTSYDCWHYHIGTGAQIRYVDTVRL
jgi:hypothetical protein